MHNRAPAVTFKRQSLENWMEIFAQNDWQKSFSSDEIRDGIDFLEKYPIKEIEIRPDDVIVRYLGENKSQLFAIIDLEGGQLSARSSIANKNDAAIGALIAMDEAIIDKQDVLFSPEADSDVACKNDLKDDINNAEDKANSKPLRLSFYISGQSLCFKAYWIKTNKLVFPDNLSRFKNIMTKQERDSVIQLIHLARKVGFSLYQQSKEYRIGNISASIDFCRYTLPQWYGRFEIQVDDNIQKLQEGTKEIHASFQANNTEDSEHEVDLSLQLANNNYIVPSHFAKKVLKSDGSPLFIEGFGAVRMSKKEIAIARTQYAVLNKFNNSIPRYMLYSIFNLSDIPYKGDPEILAWQQSFASKPEKPFILPKILRSYQREGVLWINHILKHGFHGLIADDMGLGKTLQVLTFISKMDSGHQTIVICPASVVYVWQKEAQKFFPKLNVRIFSSESDLNELGVNIWVISYTQLRRNKSKISKKVFQLVVLDEAQFIKNPTTKIFYACTGIKSTWRLALSGTPIENNLLDLWSIFRFLMPGLLGEKSQFIELCKLEDIGNRIKKQIAPFMLRRTKETVASELPQKIEINVSCEMTQLQHNLYQSVIHNTLKQYRDEKNHFDFKNHRFGILSALTRLRQVACDPGIVPSIEAPLEESGKLNMLKDILGNEFSGAPKKVVIFSQFVSFLQRIKGMLRERFPEIELFEIIGSTKNRNIIVDNFQTIPKKAIILVSLKAGGIGITLTAAEVVFLMDPWWNPSTEKQAMDRVHRIGQDKQVTIYRFITQNSIESGIQRLQEKKTSLFSEIIDSLQSKQSGTEYFLDHIHELLQQE